MQALALHWLLSPLQPPIRQGNLLDLSIKAIRLRATVGEVSDALERSLAATAPTPKR